VLRRARTTDDRREGARGVTLTTRWEYEDEDSLNKVNLSTRTKVLFRLSEEEFSQRGDGLT
jgi:hypothetical protein